MGEWFSSNASAIITLVSALLSAIVAGGFALFGSRLNNQAAKEQREEHWQVEKWRANRELYLRKGEEVSDLLDRWHENTHQVMLLQMFRALGTKTQQQVDEEWKEFINKEIQPRISALLSIYFSDAVSDFELATNFVGKIHLSYGLFLAGDLDVSTLCIEISKAMDDVQNKTKEIRVKLATLTKAKL
ncbi:TPA: hypothetical protein ACGE6V_004388 [Serratia marcescens]|uniref:hypothetical protein n=1 Tax=Serratia marcescens TaxID=615 RepID=UPI0036F55423